MFSQNPLPVIFCSLSWLIAPVILLGASASAMETPQTEAEITPVRVLAVVSGGFWQEDVETTNEADDSETETAKEMRRGYFRSIAFRSEDNTSRLYLQRIWLSPDGPTVVDTKEIEALTELNAYITDMRPENSTGVASQPGFVTFIYLKQDPAATEPDTWELYVDEFGDMAFTPATN
ncbi:hypothetical protein [Hoeflea prorocentri]|uniref:Uncharacterized protein n=1 Tax=Hoeflea prorocentri TaxID=1922333 RepID=A0A9X3UHQ7_9HYPH|nr:hypothetical protein [Hoeflea prorocentri]MCY6380887.1 hypothetical protein [Hoeflea prorocentri]MDA5398687.1 hypothetical protein [Hoeflea prorocentri]